MATIAALATLALLAARVRNRSPSFPATTIVSRTGRVPKQSEDAMVLLAQAANCLSPGASVAYVRPDRRNARDDQIMYLVALGQLPLHHVLPPTVLDDRVTQAPLPEFVVAFDGALRDDRYREVVRLDGGAVYLRR